MTDPTTSRPSRLVDTDHMLGIAEANNLGVSGLARRAEEGTPTVLLRHGHAVACVLPLGAYYDWQARTRGAVLVPCDPDDQTMCVEPFCVALVPLAYPHCPEHATGSTDE